jgi:hypothetical protein
MWIIVIGSQIMLINFPILNIISFISGSIRILQINNVPVYVQIICISKCLSNLKCQVPTKKLKNNLPI